MKDLKVELVSLTTLTEDPLNARKHLPRNRKTIKASLEKYGQVEPLIVQANSGRVIGGNGRLSVMKELGWKKAHVVKLEIDDLSASRLALTLNRSAELAVWDETNLGNVLKSISPADYDLVGFDGAEIQALIDSVTIPTGDELPDFTVPASDVVELPVPKSLLQFTIVFDNEQQQERFKTFLSRLKKTYTKAATVGDRLDHHIRDKGGRTV